MKTLLLALAVTVGSLCAEDATGTWRGKLQRASAETSESQPALMILKQEGTTVTGTAGPGASEQYPIENGKITDGRLTFSVPEKSMKFDLKQTGETLAGKLTREHEGETEQATLELKREK